MGEIEKKSIPNSNSKTRPVKQYPNPPETGIPDPATLREQWSYAKRQYSRWYSSAWGTAILAGLSFYALGWIVKGSNPIPSLSSDKTGPGRTGPEPATGSSKPASDSSKT